MQSSPVKNTTTSAPLFLPINSSLCTPINDVSTVHPIDGVHPVNNSTVNISTDNENGHNSLPISVHSSSSSSNAFPNTVDTPYNVLCNNSIPDSISGSV